MKAASARFAHRTPSYFPRQASRPFITSTRQSASWGQGHPWAYLHNPHFARGKYGNRHKGTENGETGVALWPHKLQTGLALQPHELLNLWFFNFVLFLSYNFFRHLLPWRNFTRHVSLIGCWWESYWWYCPYFADEKTEVLRNSVTCPDYSASKKAFSTVKLMLFPLSIHTHSTALSAAANLASWMPARYCKLHPT